MVYTNELLLFAVDGMGRSQQPPHMIGVSKPVAGRIFIRSVLVDKDNRDFAEHGNREVAHIILGKLVMRGNLRFHLREARLHGA